MQYLLDTHTLYWFFENTEKIPSKVLKILQDENNQFIVPTIVLAELKYIFRKYRLLNDFGRIYKSILSISTCLIIPLYKEIVETLPTEMEMHDSIIIATAQYFENITNQKITVITCDNEIRKYGKITTIW